MPALNMPVPRENGPEAGHSTSGPLSLWSPSQRHDSLLSGPQRPPYHQFRERHRVVDHPVPLLLIERVHVYAVPRHVARVRGRCAAGGACVGAVPSRGEHVSLQTARPREGVAAGSADVGASTGTGALLGVLPHVG